jgi:hypothetical protein
VDEAKTPEGSTESVQPNKSGLDRRSIIKGVLLSAAALGGAFAPAIKAYAQSASALSFQDTDVTASNLITSLRDMTAGLIGPSDSLKTSIVDKLNQANGALVVGLTTNALSRLDEAEVIITNNQAELDNANGGLELETDEEGSPAAPGLLRKLGGLILKGVQFVKNLGSGIRTFVQRIFGTRIACVVRCIREFAACLNKPFTIFQACIDVCKYLLAIPFVGNALFAGCAIVCALLVKNQVLACLAAFQACVRSC